MSSRLGSPKFPMLATPGASAKLLLLCGTWSCAHSPPAPKAAHTNAPTHEKNNAVSNTASGSIAIPSKASRKLAFKEIVAAADRPAKDQAIDERRAPLRMLEFFDVGIGDRVADLGAGSGYTTELLARAVGRSGVVYSQNDRRTLSLHIEESWLERVRREALKNVVIMRSVYESPFLEEASSLDLVTFLFSYHDAIAQGVDRQQLNLAVFRALKPGRLYIIADHEAPAGSGLAVASTLHRIEASIIRREVEAAGFEFVESANFLHVDHDEPTRSSPAVGFKTNRYVLKFRHPY